MSDKERDAGREPFDIYPIERVDVYRSILGQLESVVQALKPGDRMPSERELVERLNVSRVSVREALRALESMGKIEIRRNAGSFVRDAADDMLATYFRNLAPIDFTFLQNLTDIRAAIEDRVALSVVDREVELSEVLGVLKQMESELGAEEHEPGSLDLRFEAALGKLSGNPLLAALQRAVHQSWVEAWSVCGIAPGSRELLLKEHYAIYEAIRDRDIPSVRRRIADHVDRLVVGGHDDESDTNERKSHEPQLG